MTKKPRIIVTLKPKNYEILKKFCKEYTQTKSEMINVLIELQNERTPIK